MRPSTLYEVLLKNDVQAALVIAGTPNAHKLSRRQLRECIERTAAQLQQAGIRPGDVVSLAFTNTVDFVIAFLAITYARAVAAPLNSAYKQDEFEFFLGDASAKLLLLPEEGNTAASAAANKMKVPVAQLRANLGSGTPTCTITPMPGCNLVFGKAGGPALQGVPLPTDIALFLHTSGTTSRPKGVPLTHGNLAASLGNIVATYELVPSDRSYVVMPLFHVHGLMAGLLAPLAAGATVVLPAGGKFSAAVFWPDCVAHGVTFYTAVPTMHQVLLSRAATDYPASAPPPLRFIRSCSSSLAPATLQRLEDAFKVPVLEAYAMTEASHQMTSNPLPKHGPHKAGSVGRAQGGVTVGILDNSNALLPTGKVGEVCIRGSNVTAGYLNNPTANVEAYAGGWFHTGDQGFLDSEGYLTLTGRLKELINRGGEKISPLEVDSVLLSHPFVAEAVSFGAPDEKYGEVVAAAVVLTGNAPKDHKQVIASIKAHCLVKLAAFKVPGQVFITDVLPKTATGKIQRRHMVTAFMTPAAQAAPAASSSSASASDKKSAALTASLVPPAGIHDGYEMAAQAMAGVGIKLMFGVVGIPVTPLASAAQAAGIRFIGMRNEQSAGYAASAAGFLTGVPAVLLTVSGPGAVNGIAGLSHAAINTWPLIMVSGSADTSELGKGAFQECDQVQAASGWVKYGGRASRVSSIGDVVAAANRAAMNGRPGAAYVDLPSNILLEQLAPGAKLVLPPVPTVRAKPQSNTVNVSLAGQLLSTASRPLLVLGKGAAQGVAETAVRALAERWGLPCLATAMARGVVPDDHPLCVNAARSAALKGADVVLVVGARLNWQLHFGEAPKWASGVKFILLDIAPSPRDVQISQVVMTGDAAIVVDQLNLELKSLALAPGTNGTQALNPEAYKPWLNQLQAKAQAATRSLSARLAAPPTGPLLDYYAAMSVLRKGLAAQSTPPVVISEGANTMDMARLCLPVLAPRTRLDAGTWGTMGVGLGYAIAAAVTHPGELVVAVEGDSAFGFSGMECETIARYKLPIVVIVFNNGGIYGGDRREVPLSEAAGAGAAAGGFKSDPAPTAFVPGCRYDQVMSALGGDGYHATTQAELHAAVMTSFAAKRPALINIVIDPHAGVESGNVHSFNTTKAKL